MSNKQPRQHPIIDRPTTVADCNADRKAAQGRGPATTQLAETRGHAAEQARTR
jgi:hypothetical protein